MTTELRLFHLQNSVQKVLSYLLTQVFIKLLSPTLIDDLSRGNNKQSGYVQIHGRAEKIVEGIVNDFC